MDGLLLIYDKMIFLSGNLSGFRIFSGFFPDLTNFHNIFRFFEIINGLLLTYLIMIFFSGNFSSFWIFPGFFRIFMKSSDFLTELIVYFSHMLLWFSFPEIHPVSRFFPDFYEISDFFTEWIVYFSNILRWFSFTEIYPVSGFFRIYPGFLDIFRIFSGFSPYIKIIIVYSAHEVGLKDLSLVFPLNCTSLHWNLTEFGVIMSNVIHYASFVTFEVKIRNFFDL